MRIIDKNTDFYDYLQNAYRDNNVTFDRTDSFLLTKDVIRAALGVQRKFNYLYRTGKPEYQYILLQIGFSYWLFIVKITAVDNYRNVKTYDVDLMTKWKNYDSPSTIINLEVVNFERKTVFGKKNLEVGKKYLMERAPILENAVRHKEYEVHYNFCDYVHLGDLKDRYYAQTYRRIPLLKASGLSQFLIPLEVYLSLEEHFSHEKTSSERTTSVGITDKEKIENHGFDVKTSFRG